ncbi:lysozyme [Leptolyngbya ohadii]|uniref:lysozyme n=1 Tax=Leptolyngbya ohadii TaxID=1962290 RepID=UPI0021F0F081|nr:lysozyme [Leptolyngbya ohadii]
MAYSLRMVLDTWLKQSTAQGSKLPENQKQFVRAGTVLPIVAFTPAPDDHWQVTLGRDAQGQQVQFQGKNTWFVYRPAAQILQNGQAINPAPTPSPTPSPPMYTLRTVLDTWLKQTTGQGSTLPDDQRQFINSGTVLPLNSFADATNNHLKITLGRNAQGQQVQFKGRNTWFVYRPAAQILQNGKPTPAPAPAPTPAPTPQPSTFAVRALIDTWLKQTTAQGSNLPDSQRQFINSGTVLPIAAYEAAPDNHLRITLGIDAQGNQVWFKGKNTWLVFQSAVQLLRNGQPIGPMPSPSPGGARQINSKGLRLLKSFEGLRLEAYLDAVGVWTIGYGTTSGVFPGQVITEAQAEAFLKRDLRRFEAAVIDLVTVPLNDDQFSALVSFTYNVGEGAFAGSTLLRLLNQRDYRGAADQFLRWNLGDGVELPGLTRRRRAERALFLGEDYTVFL